MVRFVTFDDEDENMNGFVKKVEVRATVYYKAPRPAYAVRKSTVVEVVKNPFRRCGPVLPRLVYVLANGERLRWLDAFPTREAAEAALIENLKSKLAFQKVALANLQYEMAYEEKALKRLESSKSAN